MKTSSFIIAFLLFCRFSPSFSQTILAPDLQCVQNDAVNGSITLSWTNPPQNPCGPFVQYTIYGSSLGPNGPYDSIIAVTSQVADSFVLIGFLASSPDWHFFMEANYNCPGAIVLQSDTIDNKNPITPVIINVTVTPGEDVVFNWEPSISPQTHSYAIFYFLPNGNAVPLATVDGRFNTSYTDVAVDPTSASIDPCRCVSYTVAAVDSCGAISAFNTSPHNTIFLEVAATACQNQLDLVWNKYNNWPIGVRRYEIYARINQGAFNLAGAVDSNTFQYAFSGFSDGDSVCLFVRAVSGDDTLVVSNSNIVCLEASIVQPPSYIFITNATVELDNRITVTWTIDSSAELTFYKIERGVNGVAFTSIDQLSAPANLNAFETYRDSLDLYTQKNPYYYQIVAVDSCQSEYETPFVKTIRLKGELYDYYTAHLDWNDFELHGATVTAYNLYRNHGTGYQLIRTFPFGTASFSDSLHQFLAATGIFCYRIEAVYNISLPEANYQATLSSWSNEMCIIHRPIIYIPTAFAPEGLNNIFKPTIIYGEPRAYVMQIYNRWGGLVFESNDPAVGWDGTDHGKDAQQGGYAYLIQFYANDDMKIERKGMVLLVR